MSKVILPEYVAEYLDFAKSDTTLMRVMELANTRNEWEKWEKEYDWIEVNHEKFARAWLDGYELEPEFKVGDWVVHENGNPIRRVTGFFNNYLEVSDGEDGYIWAKPFARHAKPEEIAEEKERRWWSDRNREIWELRTRDILINENEDTFEVTNSNPPEGYYSIGYTLFDLDEVKGSFRVLCFAENREDVKDDE